jgi:transcription factor TFIIIB component B''
MSYVLPGRDRKACKAKFKTEDKKNSQRINHCLKNSIPYGESQPCHPCVIEAKPRNPPLDMQTLSRMTGKDFSGPVPVIRAKPPPNLEPSNPDTESASIAARKQSRTPGPTRPSKDGAVEAEPSSTRPGVKAAPSVVPQKAKKSANDMSQNDVEVLGTIDGDWD